MTLDQMIERERAKIERLHNLQNALRKYVHEAFAEQNADWLGSERAQIVSSVTVVCNQFYAERIYAAGLALDALVVLQEEMARAAKEVTK